MGQCGEGAGGYHDERAEDYKREKEKKNHPRKGGYIRGILGEI